MAKHWQAFAATAIREQRRVVTDRIAAAWQAVSFHPGKLANYHFHRYLNYRQVEHWIDLSWNQNKSAPHVVEFGGSNGAIASFFRFAQYEVAPDFPEVDIQDLQAYSDAFCDVVVLDQILEHVPDPGRAVSEIHRILKSGGVCICITPFLVKLHGYPEDYHRFTNRGLAQLFRHFSDVTIRGWGNRCTLEMFHRYGWLSARNAQRILNVALWNETEWPIEYLTWAVKRSLD